MKKNTSQKLIVDNALSNKKNHDYISINTSCYPSMYWPVLMMLNSVDHMGTGVSI